MSRNRREFLKKLGVTLPVAWSVPVIQAVLVPAHAQLSTCAVLSIAGISLSCPADAPAQTATLYQVDDTGPCPVLITLAGSFGVSPTMGLQVETSMSVGFVYIGVRHNVGGTLVNQGCPIDDTSDQPLYFFFAAQSGATWRADYNISTDAGLSTLTLSTISLSPV